jgi:peptidoglycan/LPS O-acetylase OafA/YrhL
MPGSFGVTLFFFISGFIITRLLLAEEPTHVAAFYVRRFFRLYPALVFYVACSMAAMALSGEKLPWDAAGAVLVFFTNYYEGTSGANVATRYFSHAWSLAVEEHFYIFFPLLFIALRSRPQALTRVLTACLVACLGLRAFEVSAGYLRDWIQLHTHTRIDSIAYGCLLAVLFSRAQTEPLIARWLDALSTRAALFGAVVLLAVTFAFRSFEFRQTLRYSLQGLAFMVIFCALFWGRSAPRWMVRILESRPMIFVGAISYSLYLIHPVGMMIGARLGFEPISWKNALITVSVTIPLLWVSFVFIERPCRRYGAVLANKLSNARPSEVSADRSAPAYAELTAKVPDTGGHP